MSFCNKCGKPVPEGSQFCAYCGAELCTNFDIAPDSSYCRSVADFDHSAPAKKKSPKKRILISAVCLATAVCLAAVLIFLLPRMQPASKDEISEADAEKMISLVDYIADMDAQGATAEDVYAYLDSLEWIEDIRYEDSGSISCRTTFGVTAVWGEAENGYISSASSSDNKYAGEQLKAVEKFVGDGLNIVILCPYASVDSSFILDGYTDMANQLAKETSGSVTVLEDEDVSLECLKSLDQYDMVFFYSHGWLSSVFNSAWAIAPSDPYTMTGEFAKLPSQYAMLSRDFYCGRTIVDLSTGRIGIGGNFYTHYYKDRQLENMFFHFGSCYSMHTNTISDALLSRGAAWVEGWSNSVEFPNDFKHMYGVGAGLLCGYSVEKSVALTLSDPETQKYAQSDCAFVTAGDGTYQITVEPAEQEIINSYKETCHFYAKWVCGGGGVWAGPSDDYVETYESGNVSTDTIDYYEKHCRTYDKNITTVAQLKDGLYSHFNSEYADDFFKRLDPLEDGGKLFTYYGGGWGADWEGVDKLESIEKTGDHTCVLTVSGNGNGGRLYGKIACEYKDRQYHFCPSVEHLYDEDGNNSYPGEFAFFLASDADLSLPSSKAEETGSTEPPESPATQQPPTHPEASSAVEFNGHRYCVFDIDTITDWNIAQEYCEAQGGHLATITSAEEDVFLYSYIVNTGYSSAMFGLSDQEETDDWRWVTGEVLSYQNWHSGEPSHQGGYEHYGMYYSKFTDGTWNDGSGQGGPFICEWESMEDSGRVSVEVVPGTKQRVGAYDVTVDTLAVIIPENKNAAEKIMNVFLEWREKANSTFSDISSDSSGSESGDAVGFDTIELTVSRADSNIISVYLFETTYHGGNLCVHGIKGFTFSVQSGDLLELSDLAADVSALTQVLHDACWNQLLNEPNYSHLTGYKEGFDRIFSEENYEWTLDSDGIHIYFPEYSIGSHADGIIDFVVPYSDVAPDVYAWVLPLTLQNKPN